MTLNLGMLLWVAAGGALGASARFLMTAAVTRLLGSGFPYGTMSVNILGSFLIGAAVESMALRWPGGMELRAFLAIGILGAFTTFSTFSLDVISLVNNGNITGAGCYILGSVVLSVGGLIAGLKLTRLLLG